MRWLVALSCLAAGCASVLGIDEDYTAKPSSGTGGEAGSGGVGAGGGTGGTTGGGGTGGSTGGGGSGGGAVTLTLAASDDSMVRDDNPSYNGGNNDIMTVRPAAPLRRAFVRFDLSSVPAGATVSQAILSLCATSGANGREHAVHAITESWTENVLTWSNQPAVAATPSSTRPAPTEPGCEQWDLTADVRAWVDSGSDHGWRLSDTAENQGSGAVRWATKENATEADRPSLEVTYVP